MNNADLDEDSPIVKAIDRGGGQTCDIAGVLRELDAAGYAIVPKAPTMKMIDAAYKAEAKADTWFGLKSAYLAMIASIDK